MTRDEQLTELTTKLDVISRLLALQICAQMRADSKVEKEQIEVLAQAGLDRHAIAGIVGTTPGTVSVALSKAKKNAVATGQKGRSKDSHSAGGQGYRDDKQPAA